MEHSYENYSAPEGSEAAQSFSAAEANISKVFSYVKREAHPHN